MRAHAFFAGIALLTASQVAFGQSQQNSIRLTIDQTAPLKLSAPASSVAIGNGSIAEVSAHDPTTVLITGKVSGSTSLLVLGLAGETLFSGPVLVSDERPGQITIVRGAEVNTYSCISKCRPTPTAGDSPDFFGNVMKTVAAAAAAASGE